MAVRRGRAVKLAEFLAIAPIVMSIRIKARLL